MSAGKERKRRDGFELLKWAMNSRLPITHYERAVLVEMCWLWDNERQFTKVAKETLEDRLVVSRGTIKRALQGLRIRRIISPIGDATGVYGATRYDIRPESLNSRSRAKGGSDRAGRGSEDYLRAPHTEPHSTCSSDAVGAVAPEGAVASGSRARDGDNTDTRIWTPGDLNLDADDLYDQILAHVPSDIAAGFENVLRRNAVTGVERGDEWDVESGCGELLDRIWNEKNAATPLVDLVAHLTVEWREDDEKEAAEAAGVPDPNPEGDQSDASR